MTRHTSGFVGSNEALTALDHLGHFVGLLASDGTLLEANTAALLAGGLSRDDVVGRPFWEAPWWSHSPTEQQRLRAAIDRARDGEVVRYDATSMADDGGRALTTIGVQLTPVRDDDGVVRHLVAEGSPIAAPGAARGTATDITDSSWANLVAELNGARAQADALRLLASALAASRTVDDVASAIAENLGPTVGAVFANVAVAPPDENVLHLFQPSTMRQDIAERWVAVPLDHSTPLGAAVLEHRPVHAADPAEVERQFASGAADATRLGLRSLAAYPIETDGGSVRAAIGLAWASPTPQLSAGRVDPAVALCGAALQRAWIADESTRIAALLDTLLQRAPVGFAFIDREFRFNLVNDLLAEANGRTVAEHVGLRIGGISTEMAEQTIPILHRVFDEGTPVSGVEISGSARIWEAGFYPVDAPGLGIIGAGVVMVEVTEQRREQQALRDMADRERDIARRLQAGLLPTGFPDLDGYECSARYEAGTAGLRVGGDWYEVVEIRPGDVAIVVGDAVGHDLDAAIAMSQIRNALTGLGHSRRDPARVIERLDEYAATTPQVFASTIFYARLDPETGELRYTLAGHHPPVLVHADGTHDWFDAQPGPPVGVTSERSTATCRLEPGDTLICYTDGLIEHHSEPIEAGRARLLDTIERAGPTASLDTLVGSLLTSVPNPERPDDIVVLAVRRSAEGSAVS